MNGMSDYAALIRPTITVRLPNDPIPGREGAAQPDLPRRAGRHDAPRHSLDARADYAAVLSLALFITWPKEGFLSLRDLPFTYKRHGRHGDDHPSLPQLHPGARNLLGAQDVTLRDWLAFTPLPVGVCLRGYLAAGSVETLFFWGLSWPLMLLAGGVSGESLAHLGTGMLVLLSCLTAYRVIGVTLLIWFERDDFRPLHPGARRVPVVHPGQRLRVAAR